MNWDLSVSWTRTQTQIQEHKPRKKKKNHSRPNSLANHLTHVTFTNQTHKPSKQTHKPIFS